MVRVAAQCSLFVGLLTDARHTHFVVEQIGILDAGVFHYCAPTLT